MNRLQNSSDLDYGDRWVLDKGENYLVSKAFVKGLFENHTICRDCKFLLEFKEIGRGVAKTISASCTNKFCKSATLGNISLSLILTLTFKVLYE